MSHYPTDWARFNETHCSPVGNGCNDPDADLWIDNSSYPTKEDWEEIKRERLEREAWEDRIRERQAGTIKIGWFEWFENWKQLKEVNHGNNGKTGSK